MSVNLNTEPVWLRFRYACPLPAPSEFVRRLTSVATNLLQKATMFNTRTLLSAVTLLCVGFQDFLWAEVPDTTETYQGRAEDAPWREQAEKRIEKIRKADLTLVVKDQHGNPIGNAQLEVKQQSHAFWFGTEIRGLLIISDPQYLKWKGTSEEDAQKYRDVAKKFFNITAFGNDLVYNFWYNRGKETSVRVWDEWLDTNGIALRGIPLVWSGKHDWKNPPELMALPKEQLRKRLNTHITEIMETLDGKCVMWDVLNEPISEPYFVDVLGREEAVKWYKLAREMEPQAKLYCNDYSILLDREKLDQFIELVQSLLNSGAPIDGVSPQSHLWQGQPLPSMESLKEQFDLLAELGLEIYPDQFEVINSDEQLQADYTRDFYIMAFSHPAVVGVTHWGFWEGDIWMKQASWFRKDWSPTPCGEAMMDLLYKKWWTEIEGKTDPQGHFTTRGFLGKYDVTVKASNQTKKVTLEIPQAGAIADITMQL